MNDNPQIDFALPGRWWNIPLDNGVPATKRSISSLAEEIIGKHDELARFRYQVRTQMQKAADVAEKINASDIYVALKIVGNINLPAVLTVAWPQLPVPVVGPRQARVEALQRSLPLPGGAAANSIAEVQHRDAAVVRRITHRNYREELPEGEVFETVMVEVDYWVSMDGTGKLALFNFNFAFAELEEAMLKLFDAIVTTVRLRPIDEAARV